jgi:hypothetical protein
MSCRRGCKHSTTVSNWSLAYRLLTNAWFAARHPRYDYTKSTPYLVFAPEPHGLDIPTWCLHPDGTAASYRAAEDVVDKYICNYKHLRNVLGQAIIF